MTDETLPIIKEQHRGKKHIPDDETRRMVRAMSSYGITQEEICKVVGVNDKTLRKHYREELDTAATHANSQVAGRLFEKAMEGDTTSMIFWMKTRGKWSEKVELEHTGDLIFNVKKVIHSATDNSDNG